MTKPHYLKYPFALLLAIITVSITLVTFGYYWEVSMSVQAAAIYGNLCAQPTGVWFNEDLLFQVPILAFISACFQNIPVYGNWHILIVVLYLSLWFHLSIRLLSRITANASFIIFWSHLFVWGVIGFSMVHIHVTRDSMLLCSASILIFLDYYLYDNKKPYFFLLLYCLGCTTRVSSAALVLFALTLFVLLHFRDIKKSIDVLKFHWLIMVVCLCSVMGYKYISQNPMVIIEQNHEYALVDRRAIVPISSMQSKEDSCRYIALTSFFLVTDSAQLTLDFIKRVVDNKKYLKLGIDMEDMHHLSDSLLPLWEEHKVLLFLVYLLLCIAAWNTTKTTIFNLLMFNLFGWLVILSLAMKISMYDRFLLPWLSVFIGASLWWCAVNHKEILNRQKVLLLVLAVIIIAVTANMLSTKAALEKLYNQQARSYLQNLEKLSKTSTPIIWDYRQVCFPTEIFSRTESVVLKKCIYQTQFFIMYYDFGQERCLKKFGFSPLDWRSMNLAFNKNSDKICFVMEEGLASFLTEYYSTLYHLDFKLVKDVPVNEIYPDNFVYHLEHKSISLKQPN